jgi:hypothetical protein
VVAPQPQPISNTRSPVCGLAKASNASVTGANVMSVCSCRATHVWPPGPFQKEGKLIGVDLLGVGHASPPLR